MSRHSSPRGNKPTDSSSIVKQFKTRAKINAVGLIRACLKDSNHLPETEQEDVVKSVLEALEVAEVEDEMSEHADDDKKRVVNSYLKTEESNGDNNKKKRALSVDEHNDLCEVCETGGDLLCCDTCSLVFHLKCIRPKMSSVPKGHWSCARCIVDELAEGDVNEAKKAIRNMNRLGCGGMDGSKNSKISHKDLENIIVAQSGRKFAVRQTEDTQNIELGRFATIKEAFSFINDLAKPKRVSVKPTKSKAKKKVVTHREESSSDGDEENGDEAMDEEDDDELWCTHCLDDDSVILCAFCGCKKCFGKFDSDLLILCDHCDQEIHTYCFDPPLTEVPSEDPWYCCESCTSQAKDLAELDNAINEEGDGNESDNSIVETTIRPNRSHSSTDHFSMDGPRSGSPRTSGFPSLHFPSADGIHSRRDSIVSMASFNSQSSPHASLTSSGAPAPRGRGRPPSAHKRTLSNLSSASNEAAATNSAGGVNLPEPTNFGSPAPSEIPKPVSTTSIASVVASSANKITGVDTALTIVGKSSRRLFTIAECDCLEQLRQWAPLPDLERVMNALLRQKLSLLERIRAIDPTIFLDAHDQLYSIAPNGLIPNSSVLPPNYLNVPQYSLPTNYLPPQPGMDVLSTIPNGMSYNPLPYSYLDNGELQVPFEIPKPKRKHSKKTPGDSSSENTAKRFRSDGAYVMDGSMDYSNVSDGVQYSNQYGSYPMNNYTANGIYTMNLPTSNLNMNGMMMNAAVMPTGNENSLLPTLATYPPINNGISYPMNTNAIPINGNHTNLNNATISYGTVPMMSGNGHTNGNNGHSNGNNNVIPPPVSIVNNGVSV